MSLPATGESWLDRTADAHVTAVVVVGALTSAIVLGAAVALASGAISGLEPHLFVLLLGVPVFVIVATRHFDAVVFLAFAIFGFVLIEPAPVDLVFAGLFPIGIITKRLDVRRLGASMRIHVLVWAMLLAVFVSTLQADDRVLSTRYTVITIYCISIMYFVKMYVRSEREMARIVAGYLVGAAFALALVILDLVGVLPDEVVLEQGRARGLFKDSNVFSPFLILALVLLIDEFWRPRLLTRLPRAIHVCGIALMTIGVLLAFSRAGWGNLALTLTIYALLNVRALTGRQQARALGAMTIAFVGLAGFTIAFGMGEFLASRANVLQSYDSERFDAQRTGIELGLNHLTGIGPGMTDSGDLFAPHSLYVRSFAETGLIGATLLVALLAAIVVPMRRSRGSGDRIAGLSRSVIVAVTAGQLANGFLIDTLHWRHLWLVLGFVWLTHENRFSGSSVVRSHHALGVSGG